MKEEEKLGSIFKNYGFYLWPITVALLIIFVFIKVDSVKIKEIDSIRTQLSGAQERLTRLTAKSRLLSGLDEGKLKADYERISLVLPDGKDAPSIIRNLENSASASGGTIDSLDLTPGKLATFAATRQSQSEIPISVSFSGSLQQLTDFLRRLTTIGRAMEVRILDITIAESSASAQAKLELVAFFLFPPESTQSAERTTKVDEPLPVWGVKENETLTQINQRELLPPISVLSPVGKTDLFK